MTALRVLFAGMLLAASATESAAFPDRFDAHYTLHAGRLEIGKASVSLSPMGGGRFEYTTFSRATGAAALLGRNEIRERSVWQRVGARIRSLHYDYQRRGRKERRVEVVFDWPRGQVTNHVNGKTWRMTVPDPTFDKQSLLLAVMQDLASGAAPLSYQVADGGRLKTYVFRQLGRQRVSTALGDLDTVVVERSVAGAARKTTFWCAPSLDYLPVRIEHHESDGSITVHIRATSGFAERESGA